MERIYLAILVSAFLVLITAAGLLVTKTHIVAHNLTVSRSTATVPVRLILAWRIRNSIDPINANAINLRF